jgi:hypothetical protein
MRTRRPYRVGPAEAGREAATGGGALGAARDMIYNTSLISDMVRVG